MNAGRTFVDLGRGCWKEERECGAPTIFSSPPFHTYMWVIRKALNFFPLLLQFWLPYFVREKLYSRGSILENNQICAPVVKIMAIPPAAVSSCIRKMLFASIKSQPCGDTILISFCYVKFALSKSFQRGRAC